MNFDIMHIYTTPFWGVADEFIWTKLTLFAMFSINSRDIIQEEQDALASKLEITQTFSLEKTILTPLKHNTPNTLAYNILTSSTSNIERD